MQVQRVSVVTVANGVRAEYSGDNFFDVCNFLRKRLGDAEPFLFCGT